MVSSFPKTYRWMSEEARSRSQGSGQSSTSTSATGPAANSASPLSDVTVYSLKDVSVVQISDDSQDHPIEYQTCFTSQKHLEDAWKAGRVYLLRATLANRAAVRQKVINAVHAKFARVAMAGATFGGPPAPEGPRDEDEDGLMEPPEVQQLAAELGMQNGPAMLVGDESTPPPIAQFGATMLCGLISLAAPLAQAFGSTLDGMLSAIPIVDRVVLGDSAPPRQAPVVTRPLNSLLLDADRQNRLAAQRFRGKAIDKRLSTSALWMGISIQLLLSQYLASSTSSEVSSIVIASRSRRPTGRGKHGRGDSPIVMDVFSGLLTSLQGNDFVREAASIDENDKDGGLVTALELEQLLMRNNGLEIGFKRKDLGPVEGAAETTDVSLARGKGIILLGSLGTADGSDGGVFGKELPPVGVMNAARFLSLSPRSEKTG